MILKFLSFKEKRKKRKMKNKPVHEYTDKRYSVRHKIQQDKRRRARKVATKMLGNNYFTNMQEVMLQSAIEISERKDR